MRGSIALRTIATHPRINPRRSENKDTPPSNSSPIHRLVLKLAKATSLQSGSSFEPHVQDKEHTQGMKGAACRQCGLRSVKEEARPWR
jgi:hypothetical protein